MDKKMPKKPWTKPIIHPTGNNQTTEALDYTNLREALVAKSDMWSGRALSFIQVIDGTRIDIRSNTLLDDLEKEAPSNAEVRQFLESLPGWPNGEGATKELALVALIPLALIRDISNLTPSVRR